MAAVKSIAVTALEKSLTTVIVTQLPFLAGEPWSFLLSQLLAKIIPMAVNEAELAAFIARTDLRVDAQGRDYLDAIIRHQKAMLGNDENEKTLATKNLDEKFDAFVSIAN